MERLIANNLLYGSLFLVDQPHLVERYNRALVAFGLEPTKLMGFGIDATGYSPEIASEFDDDLYLNPFGVNQRFILLSPDQSRLPVMQSKFTSTFELMRLCFFTLRLTSSNPASSNLNAGSVLWNSFRPRSVNDTPKVWRTRS